MIYVDTSVALAHLFSEDVTPPPDFWTQALIASELLEYELLVRVNARGERLDVAQDLLSRIALMPMSSNVLGRAREPFPVHVRTLDALHLASATFLREQHQHVTIATYDERLREAALAMSFELYRLA